MGNLRVILSGLRKSLGAYFNITRETAGINLEENVWIDVIELENHLASAHKSSSQSLSEKTILHLEEAVKLYRGRFLDGFYLRDCERFENWMIQEQERFHRLTIDAFIELASYNSEI